MTAVGLGPARAEVVSARPTGGWQHLSLAVPAVPGPLRPGQFVVVPAPAGSAHVLPRTWWLAGGHTEAGYGTTLEVVVGVDGDPWQPGDLLPVTGPLGRGFSLPADPVPAVVVGHELAGAPARWLAGLLRGRGGPTHLVLVADDPDRHLDPVAARRLADSVVLCTTEGLPGALEEATARAGALVLYAAGPQAVVRTVAEAAARAGAACQVTAFDAAAGPWCGVGLCGACTVPVGHPARPVRACVDGPVLRGDLVGWQPC